MRRKRPVHRFSQGERAAELLIICASSLERVEPREQCGLALPTRWLAWPCRGINLLKCLPFGFEIRSGVMIRRIQTGVSKPAADDRHIDASGDKVDTRGVAPMSPGT